MGFLIDTDIIIYNFKGNAEVQNWFFNNRKIPKFVSVITFGELVYGARKSAHPEKNMATANRVAELFPVIDLNRYIVEVFGELKAKYEKAGTRIDDMDLLIAATAIYMNLTLVTNNRRHFSKIEDLLIENWKG